MAFRRKGMKPPNDLIVVYALSNDNNIKHYKNNATIINNIKHNYNIKNNNVSQESSSREVL